MCLCCLKQCLDRLRMNRGKHQRCGGAVAQQFMDEKVGPLAGVVRIGEFTLGGESIGIQPG